MQSCHNILMQRSFLFPLYEIMSNNQLIICKFCKRSNFKSLRGLHQHLARNKFCADLHNHRAVIYQDKDSQFGSPKGCNLSNNLKDMELAMGALFDEDECAWNQIRGNSTNNNNLASADTATDDNVAAGLDDSFELLDGDSFDVATQDGSIMEEDGFAASSESLDQFKNYVAKAEDEFRELNKDEECAIRLLDLLRRKKATLDTYDAVMEWHFREAGLLEDYERLAQTKNYLSRKVLMKRLAIRHNRDTKLAKTMPVILTSSKTKVDVIYHDARDCVQALLTDPRFSDDDFLFFDNDPFAPPPEDLDYIADVNTSAAYIETYKKLITKPERQILVPILFYIDGAVTGQFGKLEVEALKMTLGIFNRKARDKEYAWKTLGYVSNFAKENSRGKKIFVESGHEASTHYLAELGDDEGEDNSAVDKVKKAEDYHCILAAILKSYVQLEAEGMQHDLRFRHKLHKNCELVFYLHCIKCDGDEAEKLTHSYRSRTKNVAQLCRYCLCPTDDTDNPLANYPFKTEAMIKKLVEQEDAEGLKAISQQMAPNAFHGLRFGLHNKRGVHGSCPTDMLHAILLGIFKYIRDCFFTQIGKSTPHAVEINSIAKLYGKLFKRQSDRDMPKTNFANGIQKGKIMAKEFSGVMLIIAAILRSTEGRRVLASTRKRNFREIWLVRDWILLVETMLQWEAFMKLDQMEKNHVERLKKKHRFLMYLLKKVGNRTEGMGMKFMKFHAIVHLAEDIFNLGVPNNVDTGANESHHKLTKIAAMLTQKDLVNFEKQVATRLEEFDILDLAMLELGGRKLWEYFECLNNDDMDASLDGDNMQWNSDNAQLEQDLAGPLEADLGEVLLNKDAQTPVFTGGASWVVWKAPDSDELCFNFPGSRMKNKHEVCMDTGALRFVFGLRELTEPYINSLEIRTEHKRNGTVFRAHPQYRQHGQWHDWVLVDWGPDGQYPAEIWGFVDLEELPPGVRVEYGGIWLKSGVYAIVESASYVEDADEIGLSDIFIPLIKEAAEIDHDGFVEKRKFYLADVEAFVEPIVVIPDVGSVPRCKYFQVKSRSEWAKDFIEWIKMPHYHDVIDVDED